MTDTPDQGADAPAAPEFPEIERMLLGAVLLRVEFFELVAEKLDPEHFVEEAFGRIWGVYQEMWRRGVPISVHSAVEPIVDDLQWPRADVAKMLAQLMRDVVVPNRLNVLYWAAKVKDVWQRREVWFLAQDMLKRCQGGLDNDAAKIIEATESKLYGITVEGGAAEDRSFTFAEAADEAITQAHAAAERYASGQLVGVPTGLTVIDNKLGGLRNTDLIIIGARPGVGKTAFAMGIADAAAKHFLAANPDKPAWVKVFSLEMSADQLALRRLCAHARVSFERVRLGHADARDLMALDQAAKDLAGLPFEIDDTAQISVSAMRTRVRRWIRKHGPVGLVVIDFLQLIGLSREERKEAGGNRVQEISTITRNLKAMAKDLGLPVLCLAQLSREVEKREDKRPMLSDLRESGTIEQDADLVGFLYREHYYLSQKTPARKERETDLDYGQRKVEWQINCDKIQDHAELIVAKNRHGSLGTLAMKFLRELMLFCDDTPGGAGGEAQRERARQLALDISNQIV